MYGFGVVLLELISGKKVVSEEDFGSELNIVHWVCLLIHFKNLSYKCIGKVLAVPLELSTFFRFALLDFQFGFELP